MSIFTSFKNTFLPSAEVSAQRRQKVFGTQSKAAAGAVIVGAAAAAIAAPVVIGATGARAIGSAVLKTAAANPIKTAAVGLVAAPVIAGVVANNPTVITKTPVAIGSFQKDLYNVAQNPSVSGFKELVKNNPVVSGVAAGLVAGSVAGAGGVLATVANTSAIRENTRASTSEVLSPSSISYLPPSSSAPSSQGSGNIEPLTPETQVLGREVQTTTGTRKKTKKKKSLASNNVRVNVLNQQTYISGRTTKQYVVNSKRDSKRNQ